MLTILSLFFLESNSYNSFQEKNNQNTNTKKIPQEKEILLPAKLKGQFPKAYTKKKIPMINFTTINTNVIILFIIKKL